MKENKIHNNDDEIIRQMMRSAKTEAPENLKYRIMQQIETESALTRKKAPVQKEQPISILKDFGSIFGTMYVVLAVIIGGAYALKGKDFLFSSDFLWTIILVAFIFSMLWLITRVDARVRDRRRKTSNR